MLKLVLAGERVEKCYSKKDTYRDLFHDTAYLSFYKSEYHSVISGKIHRHTVPGHNRLYTRIYTECPLQAVLQTCFQKSRSQKNKASETEKAFVDGVYLCYRSGIHHGHSYHTDTENLAESHRPYGKYTELCHKSGYLDNPAGQGA